MKKGKKEKKKVYLGNDRTFANAFRYFRELAGLTQTEAAERTELSQSAISRFEDGDNWPCNNRRDTNDPRSILAENAASAVAEAITQIIQREANRQPTIKIKPGYRFMIFVQHDIIFPRIWHK